RIDLRATLSDPGLQPLQLVLQGRAGADAQAARWALDGRMNDSPFDSNGQAQLAGARPEIQAQARFDSLDLNRLLAPEKPAPTAPAASDTPVRMDALDAVDGRFTVAVETLAWRQYRVTGMKAEATLTQGRLDLQRLAGRSWGGNIVASGHAIAASQALAIKLEAEGVDVQALLKDVAGKDLLEGRGRVQADVTTSGANIGAMRSQLAGRVAIQVRDGAVKGLNLARAMRQARAALSGQQDALSQAKATEKTDFTELSASARIASGVAHSDDLDLKSPYLRIGGAGRFDIGQGRIDYTARATVTASPAGQDGAELRALRGVTVPVVLSGPFDAIDWRIQWSGVAAAALENKLHRAPTDEEMAKD
ncbi:MAG: AsmA-like C-terminal region-containing protein, partial [Rhodoglobus sp.]|nr:AsmA-like C-terminal region-containing protein [Rhodoglobus sp.]